MATEIAAASGAPATGQVEDKGLKSNAIGYVSNIVIGVASTAPAYSLAATLGFIVADPGVTTHAPGILLASFIPMLLIALGYRYLNKADPDAGTTFAWTTRAFGPGMGWVNGWAIFLADILVMASLGYIAATYTFLLFEWHWAEVHKGAALVGCVLWIWLMTWICHRGIELSARVQQLLLTFEVVMLVIFSVVALVDVYSGNAAAHSIQPHASWFNPFALPFHDLIVAMLLGIFIYWGWDSGVAVNEESEDANEGPGRAAVVSTLLLVAIYLLVSAGAQSYHGTEFLANEENASDVLHALGKGVLGAVGVKFLIVAVLTSASASTQTTILPTARTT
ncbi:MAG TPA: APC family permease, partial [Solirubrobacteraceae bacterium]|nr:APC family permease [Solirubrobacteraceae bacterium]